MLIFLRQTMLFASRQKLHVVKKKKNHKLSVGISVDIFQSNSDLLSALVDSNTTVVIVYRFTASRLFDTLFWIRAQRYRQVTDYGIENCTDRHVAEIFR